MDLMRKSYSLCTAWETKSMIMERGFILPRILILQSVRDNIDVDILEELLSLGGLGIQYCIKSELAYSRLHEFPDSVIAVDYAEFNEKYNQRDVAARTKMRDLVNSDANKVTRVFSTLF